MKEKIHVIKRGVHWIVEKENGRVLRIHDTRELAITYAQSIEDANVVIHRPDGSVMGSLKSKPKKLTGVELLEI